MFKGVKQIWESLVKAHGAIGLIHNDLHAQNVLIHKKNGEIMPIIMDFENALIDRDRKCVHFVVKDFIRLLFDFMYAYDKTLELKGGTQLALFLQQHENRCDSLSIIQPRMFSLIDKLEWSRNVPTSLVYDPFVF